MDIPKNIPKEQSLREAVQARIDAGEDPAKYNGVDLYYWVIRGTDEKTKGRRCIVGEGGMEAALRDFFGCHVFVFNTKKPGTFTIAVGNAYIGDVYELESKSMWYVHE